ncbi:C25 family cysteine peptidase [Candidatus Cloacimonadota bacterium]
MKRSILILIMLSICSFLLADWVEISSVENMFTSTSESTARTSVHFNLDGFERETVIENGVSFEKISYQNEGHFLEVGKPALPRFSRLIAIPNYGEVTLNVNVVTEEKVSNFRVYPAQELQSESEINRQDFVIDADFYAGNEIFPAKIAQVDEPAIMRDYRLVNVTVNPFQYDPKTNELRIISEVEIEVVCENGIGENPKSRNVKPSRFFEPLYRSSILNYEDVSLREDGYQDPSYLFIYPESIDVLEIIEYLAEWKHQKGFEVNVASTVETGTNLNDIKAFIQDAYDNWENPPEFVCLVGDAGGQFDIPTGHIDGGMYNGEGDQFYALLEGDDILADVFLGRLSFNTIAEFQTIAYKLLNYEKEPYVTTTAWYNQVLLVGDPSNSGTSTIDTKMNVKDMIEINEPDMNITEVYNTNSGSWVSQIVNGINSGVSYFNYRGFANMSGFNEAHIYNLNNGYMLPVAVFITCITGDFEGTMDCRSEAFLKAGNPGSPSGAIAAIATATGNTHTCFNNCVDAGIYYGIFSDKIYHMGGALNRGKLALYNNYPGNPGNHVNQFSYWNNLMGDPGLEIWTDVPQPLIVNYDSNIPTGANFMEIEVLDSSSNPIENAWVTILQGDDDIFETGYTDNSGNVILPIPENVSGEVVLTATCHNFIPHRGTFTIVQAMSFTSVSDVQIDDDNNGTSSGNGDGIINPGETIELVVTLQNNGAQIANNITAVISSENTFITISDDTEVFGNIPVGSTVASPDDFDFVVAASTLESNEIELEIMIMEGGGQWWTDYINLPVSAPELAYQDYIIDDGNNGILFPGETANLQVALSNIGSISAANVQADLTSWDSHINILDDQGNFGSINSGAAVFNSTDPFEINAIASAVPGSIVELELHVFNADGYDDTINFSIQIGEIQVGDPIGPDAFGYYCYDEDDTSYLEAPQYQWIEIDPLFGGTGTDLGLYDMGNEGDITNITLPFDLTFYDEVYSSLTICSNGWISPGETQSNSFMNWTIPGPLGPSPIIAPFWDDLLVTAGSVCYEFLESMHIIVIEWSNVTNEYNNDPETFQVIIYDETYYPTTNGNNLIKFQYEVVNNVDLGAYGTPLVGHGQYATVGIADQTGTIGLEYTFNNIYPAGAKVLEDQMALMFAGPPEEHINPFINLGEIVVTDENSNGVIEYGEEIILDITLNNIGQNMAHNVQAELQTSDEYVTLTSSQSSYNNIGGFNSAVNLTDFSFDIADNCPDSHPIILQLNVTSDEDNWILFFSLEVCSPNVVITEIIIEDGNNHIFNPGETADVIVTMENIGGSEALDLNCNFSTSDPYATITMSSVNAGNVASGGIIEVAFEMQVDSNAPLQHEMELIAQLSTISNFTSTEDFSLFVTQVPVHLEEHFEIFPPAGWQVVNSGFGGTGWQYSGSNVAGGGNSGISLYMCSWILF